MPTWTEVGRAEDLPPGSRKVVNVDGVRVAVFNVDGEFSAIEDVCTHDNGELASGQLEGEEIVCPRHGARFSVRSGRVLGPLGYQALAVMQVRVTDGLIEVRDPRWS